MTSEEHYQEAENWIGRAERALLEDRGAPTPGARQIASAYAAVAQVHATLANAPLEQVEVIQR